LSPVSLILIATFASILLFLRLFVFKLEAHTEHRTDGQRAKWGKLIKCLTSNIIRQSHKKHLKTAKNSYNFTDTVEILQYYLAMSKLSSVGAAVVDKAETAVAVLVDAG